MTRIRESDTGSFLQSLPRSTREIVAALRRIILAVVPEAEESILWSSLSYHRPLVGGRVKGAVCLIAVKNDQVRLDFIHGIRLTDPAHLLQGRQISKRFVPIGAIADAERSQIAELIREAAELNPSEWG